MTTSPPDQTQIVTFRLEKDLFAADIFSVERVLRYHAPTPIPNAPDWVEGVIEYHERVIPVIDLRARFGLPAVPAGPQTRILVLNAEGEWIAAIVDAVLEVSTLDPTQLSSPPPLFRGLAGEYLRGIIRQGERLVIFLDVPRLLSTDERLALEQAVDERLIIERAADGALRDG